MKFVYYLSPYSVDAWEDDNRKQAWRYERGKDGPIRIVMKWFLGCPCLHLPFEWLIDGFIALDRKGHRPTALPLAADRYARAVECMWFVTSLFYSGVYAAAWWALNTLETNPPDACDGWLTAVLGLAVFFAVHRLLDILALAVRLFVLRVFETRDIAFSLLVVSLAYLQVIVCFGALYLAAHRIVGDLRPKSDTIAVELPDRAEREAHPIQPENQPQRNAEVRVSLIEPDRQLFEKPLEALYLSAIIITTLDTGPYSFERTVTKVIVLAEVLYGIMFLAIIIQGVISGNKDKPTLPFELPNDFFQLSDKNGQYAAALAADETELEQRIRPYWDGAPCNTTTIDGVDVVVFKLKDPKDAKPEKVSKLFRQ